jgi:transcription antitermination protein NusB
MAARHRSRQRALQVLYQWDMTKQPVENAISSFYDTLYSDENESETGEAPDRDEFMEELAKGTSDMATDIDNRITSKSANWRLERMPTVDRNILRMAIYEMSRAETPAAVVIDEALELARQFSGEESVSFINGILDAVHKG